MNSAALVPETAEDSVLSR